MASWYVEKEVKMGYRGISRMQRRYNEEQVETEEWTGLSTTVILGYILFWAIMVAVVLIWIW